MRPAAALAVPLCLCLGAAKAADGTGAYALKGPGRVSCAALPEDGPGERDLAAWVTGYVTAANRLTGDTFDLTPWQTVDVLMAQMRQYCAAHPQRTAEAALAELLEFVHPERLSVMESPVSLRDAGRVVVVYPSTLAMARGLLSERGFPLGAAGPDALKRALGAYQAVHGLAVTGLPDIATLLSLMQPGDNALEAGPAAD